MTKKAPEAANQGGEEKKGNAVVFLYTHETVRVKSPRIAEVRFKEFAVFARRRGLSAEDLAERFRGRVERPGEFFHRVLAGSHPETLVPYQSVIDFFHAANHGALPCSRARSCACGCGSPAFDKKKWASPGCRTRARRAEVMDRQKGDRQAVDFVDSKVRQNQGTATTALTKRETASEELI